MVGGVVILVAVGMLCMFGFAIAAVIGQTARLWRDKSRGRLNEKGVENLYGGICVGIMFLFVFAVFAKATIHHAMLHSRMVHMRASTVLRIEVGKHTITDRNQINGFVADLNQAEWISVGRRDAADPVPLVLFFSDGSELRYVARRYTHGEGVIVESPSASVLCLRLPVALETSGITLPRCRTQGTMLLYCSDK